MRVFSDTDILFAAVIAMALASVLFLDRVLGAGLWLLRHVGSLL